MPQLQELHLSISWFPSPYVPLSFEALPKTITNFTYTMSTLSSANLSQIADRCGERLQLLQINLSSNTNVKEGLSRLFQSFTRIRRISLYIDLKWAREAMLPNLNNTNRCFNAASISTLESMNFSAISHGHEYLQLEDNPDFILLVDSLKDAPNLQEFRYSGESVPEKEFMRISNFNSLTSLSLTSCPNLTDDNLLLIAKRAILKVRENIATRIFYLGKCNDNL
ncbi:hypothetical protein Ddc_03869 [Ditylenchus destructor]|nr:hypothetical protein Ddc_03869 [Ditylenchus destructor]